MKWRMKLQPYEIAYIIQNFGHFCPLYEISSSRTLCDVLICTVADTGFELGGPGLLAKI